MTIGARDVQRYAGGAVPTIEFANSNRSLATMLGGTCLTIMTFSRYSRYDRAASGEFDPLVFRLNSPERVQDVCLRRDERLKGIVLESPDFCPRDTDVSASDATENNRKGQQSLGCNPSQQ